jgi:hypothetical protein
MSQLSIAELAGPTAEKAPALMARYVTHLSPAFGEADRRGLPTIRRMLVTCPSGSAIERCPAVPVAKLDGPSCPEGKTCTLNAYASLGRLSVG